MRKSDVEPVTVYLGLGTNVGNREGNLETALELLSQRVRLLQVSSTYDTEPMGNVDQPRFLNLVARIQTRLAPLELLTLVKGIELKLGRVPGKTDSPRPMDIDILFYGDRVMETRQLVVPHPRLAERAFVLVPLVEIAPQLVHPVSGKAAEQMLLELKQGIQGVFKWPKGKGKLG